MKQLHKRLTTDLVKNILAKYEARQIQAKEAIRHLEISSSRFYQIVSTYRENPVSFSLEYARDTSNNKLDDKIEKNILKELKTEKEKIIDNPDVPTKRYNYSYLKKQIETRYGQIVSVPTIIDRAKKNGYWQKKPPKKIHDQEVITNYIGELIQHDTSHHLFAPDAKEKWCLITSVDDYSRKMLYADFLLKENSWSHILAAQSVILKYGVPLQYYPDQHSVFRYVRDRDKHSIWQNISKFTDDVDTQWKQVMEDCGVKVVYALSPQAKGKVERPYGWLQDHIVRTCAREGITKIEDGRKILQQEIKSYNSQWVHSTTKEIPDIRFRRAKKENKSFFREFNLQPPFESVKDIFCLRDTRMVDAYRKVSIQGYQLKVPGVMPRNEVELRMYPDFKTGIVEVRFWFKGNLTGVQKVKIKDLPIVQF